MNPSGVPVFYGATSRAVARAEIRPPVGSVVVTTAFHPTTTFKVLDLSALLDAHPTREFREKVERPKQFHEFLWVLNWRLAQPVLPERRLIEYVPTQVFADLLFQEGPDIFGVKEIAGISFASAQTGGRNVVIFNKFSGVVGREKTPNHQELLDPSNLDHWHQIVFQRISNAVDAVPPVDYREDRLALDRNSIEFSGIDRASYSLGDGFQARGE